MMKKRVTVTTIMMAVMMMICTAPSTALAQDTDPVIRILTLGSGWNAHGATVAASFVMGGETFEYTGDDFSAEPAPVPEGETISLTITPGEGYVVDEVSVKKLEEEPIFVVGESRTRGTDAEASVVVSHTDGTNVWSFTMPAFDAEVTVTYKVIKFTITFDPNGGTGEMSAIDNIEKGERIKLTQNAFTRSGYEFKNWNTKADDSGDMYDDKSTLQINDNITLYAQWRVKPLNPDPLEGTITETITNPDGSQTTTTSQTLETDNAGSPINIGNDDNVVWQIVSRNPRLRDIIVKDSRKNVEMLIEQGSETNVMLNTVTETNAQGQTIATSSSMTIKQTDAAEDGTPAGPTKLAIYAGGDSGDRYTIHFVSEGEFILSETYEYNDMPVVPPAPMKAEDDEYTYTFKEWTPSVARVTGDATYTAVFEAIPKTGRYTIKFVSEGEVIMSVTYEYNDMPVVPAAPTMEDDDDYTYTFKEWTPSIARVTGNATYTAVFTATPKTGGDNGGGSENPENPDVPTSGEFGNYTWEVSKSDGSTVYDVLTISGEGKMVNMAGGSPWSAYKDQIKTVYINEGETEINEGETEIDKVVSRIIGKDVFAGYTGDHVYVTVPKGKILSVIMSVNWRDPKCREIIRPTDGKVDIIDYLFANPSERTSNRELPIAVDEIYPHLKVGDTFTLASKNIGNLNTVSIPYKCYHVSEKYVEVLFGKAEMKALDIDVESPSFYDKVQIGLTVDATLTAELVAETDDTYMVTENKATKLTFGNIPKEIANNDYMYIRPENISYDGVDIDTSNIDFSYGCNLIKGDQITLVIFYREGDETDATVGTITQAGIGNASFDGNLLRFTLEYGTSEYYSQGPKDLAMTTLTVNYTTNGTTASGHFNGVKMDGSAVPQKDSDGRVNWTAQSGSRAVTTEEEDDEIEIVSGQEYEIISDGYIVLNFYTPDASITVNSVIIRHPGDANGDDKVNAKDIVEMVNEMDPNKQPSEKFNLQNADINNDKKITLDDINEVVKIIVNNKE